MRRESVTWLVLAAMLIGGFFGTVMLLNATLYSASGFVRGYLDALVRHDAEGALELAGPNVGGDASTALLSRDAMGELSDIRLVSATVTDSGEHTVMYSYRAGGVIGESTFSVRPTGTLLGLFDTWAFATSPLGVIELTVQHDDQFTANGVDLITPAQNSVVPYLVFTPGLYEFEHESHFLSAEPVRVAAVAPGEAVSARLNIQANAVFAVRVSEEVDSFLDACVDQHVLLPTGCPFGQTINNRVITTPVWSMIDYPEVVIVPGREPSEWRMSEASATAHLLVDVRSLFDGTVTTFDEDVQFGVHATVTFLPADELLIVVG
ncbi:MAG: hypothetical protein ABL886_03820 [Rhodoglobus sp.]